LTACKDVSPEAEEHPLLEAVTEQCDWGHWSWVWKRFVKCSHELCKYPIDPIINPKPIYSHSIMWKYIKWMLQLKYVLNHLYILQLSIPQNN
jgi:hypothetical protein